MQRYGFFKKSSLFFIFRLPKPYFWLIIFLKQFFASTMHECLHYLHKLKIVKQVPEIWLRLLWNLTQISTVHELRKISNYIYWMETMTSSLKPTLTHIPQMTTNIPFIECLHYTKLLPTTPLGCWCRPRKTYAWHPTETCLEKLSRVCASFPCLLLYF